MARYGSDLDCKLYIGDLPRDVSERELEDAFSYYGKLRNVWVARNPPGFAFVEFDDPRDADDAVKGLDGTTLGGGRICVEHSTGKSRPKPWQQGGGGPVSRRPAMRRAFDPSDRCYECGQRGHYAYDCSKRLRRYRTSRSRSRSASKERRNAKSVSRSRSRSRSRDYSRRNRRSRSASNRSRSRSRS